VPVPALSTATPAARRSAAQTDAIAGCLACCNDTLFNTRYILALDVHVRKHPQEVTFACFQGETNLMCRVVPERKHSVGSLQ
jgi:hypothetical protein